MKTHHRNSQLGVAVVGGLAVSVLLALVLICILLPREEALFWLSRIVLPLMLTLQGLLLLACFTMIAVVYWHLIDRIWRNKR